MAGHKESAPAVDSNGTQTVIEIRCPRRYSFPSGARGKESACRAGDLGLVPGSGRSPGEGPGYPLQYRAWEIPWAVGPGGLQFMGSQSVSHNGPRARARVHTHKHTRADSPIETNAPSGGDVDGGRCCGGRGYIQEIAVIWAHIF